MLNQNQLTNLDDTEQNLRDKQTILNTAVDIQALLLLLVDKGIITKKEMDKYRAEARNNPKYKNAQTYIDQSLLEVENYKKDPQALLRRIMNEKIKRS